MKYKDLKYKFWLGHISKMTYPHSIDQIGKVIPEFTKDIEVLRFIGKQDKDGKDVYEGDILNVHQFLFNGHEIEKEWTGLVVWIDEESCFGFTVIKGDFFFEHTGVDNPTEAESIPICNLYGLHEESFHVIGNKFENSELIKELKPLIDDE